MKTNEQYKPESVGIPNTLGGGRMPIHRTYDRKPLDACDVPGCMAKASTACQHPACKLRMCERHAEKAGESVCCPSHKRLSDQQKGTVRPWM